MGIRERMTPREDLESRMEATINRDDIGRIVSIDSLERERIMLEVYLDIRDLLAERREPRTVHPPSAPPPVLDERGRIPR